MSSEVVLKRSCIFRVSELNGPYLFNCCSVHKVLNGLRIGLLGILKIVKEIVMFDQSHVELLIQVLIYPFLHVLIFLSCVDHRLINN